VAGSGGDGRRARRLVAAVLAVGLLAAACDDDDSASASASASGAVDDTTADAAAADDTAADTAATDTAATDDTAGGEAAGAGTEGDASAFPVTIEHMYGEAVIEELPERVVTVGFVDQDAILALGVVPVGIRDWYGDQPHAVWPWAQDELGDGEPEVLSAVEMDFEAVAALRPDVIIGISSGMTEEEYGTLSAIAPTIAQSDEYVLYGEPWQAATLTIGQALGREPLAEELIAETEALFASAREEHPEFEGATAVVGYTYGNGTIGAYGPQDSRARMLVDLGFTAPPEIVERAGDQFYADFSSEEIGLLDQDVLVWIVADEVTADQIRNDPLRQQLTAFDEGREVFLSDPVLSGAMSFGSVLSFPFLFETFIDQLAAAVDGDPATEVG
jgi:iron complex transport system substrate-binding protein